MFTVKVKGLTFQANEEVAMKEWKKGARVYNSEGQEVEGIDCGVTGEFFVY